MMHSCDICAIGARLLVTHAALAVALPPAPVLPPALPPFPLNSLAKCPASCPTRTVLHKQSYPYPPREKERETGCRSAHGPRQTALRRVREIVGKEQKKSTRARQRKKKRVVQEVGKCTRGSLRPPLEFLFKIMSTAFVSLSACLCVPSVCLRLNCPSLPLTFPCPFPVTFSPLLP